MNDLPWLRDAIDRLRGMMSRLPHALLIHGPGGWGEERVANTLAAELIGLEPSGVARDVAHPDLRWLEPEDEAIRVGAIRGLIAFLMQTPQLAGRKIAVIDRAERMNPNAANALLKSLEEPPAESFVALCTSAPERLLPTVRSRCQRLEVHPAEADEVAAWLAGAGVDAELGGYLAIEYGGAPFAVRDAAERGPAPLWPALAKVGADPAAALEVAEARREENLAGIAGRWLRIVHWLVRRQPLATAPAVLDFADELAHVRRVALLNTSLNRSLQLQRLLLLWSALWPRLRSPASPRL